MTISRFFERATRADGSSFYRLTDDHPDWLYDAVFDAHDGELPNDWRYDTCHSIASMMDDIGGSLDKDNAHEIAHSLTDVYYASLARWLADDVSRAAYCDEYADEFGAPSDDLLTQIMHGQYLCIRNMASIMIDAYLNADVDSDDESDSDDETDEEGF